MILDKFVRESQEAVRVLHGSKKFFTGRREIVSLLVTGSGCR